MTEQEFRSLQRGDIIQHVTSGESYVVDFHGREKGVIAVRTIEAMNHREWKLFRKSNPPRVTMEFRNNRWEIVDQE